MQKLKPYMNVWHEAGCPFLKIVTEELGELKPNDPKAIKKIEAVKEYCQLIEKRITICPKCKS